MNQPSDLTQQIPSAQRCEPGSFPLRLANFPAINESSLGNIDPQAEVVKWVAAFNKVYSITLMKLGRLISITDSQNKQWHCRDVPCRILLAGSPLLNLGVSYTSRAYEDCILAPGNKGVSNQVNGSRY